MEVQQEAVGGRQEKGVIRLLVESQLEVRAQPAPVLHILQPLKRAYIWML